MPNISPRVAIVEAARRATSPPLETHLMIRQPERYIESLLLHSNASLYDEST